MAPNDASGLKPLGGPGADIPTIKTRKAPLRIGTWNIRTLYQAGKLDNLLLEMVDLKMDILGIVETRWTENGVIRKDNYTMIYSGGQNHQYGVGIVMANNIAQSMLGYWPVCERIIMCKIQAKPFNIVIIQVYAPTSDHDDEEVETFYETLDMTIKQTKSSDIIILMGDFNAKVGTEAMSKVIGKEGLGETNERGERLIQYCEKHDLSIMNTMFKQPKRRLYTWKSPGDLYRNQIDYVIIKTRFKNTVVDCRTSPGADIGSDHNPVIMKMKVKLKKPKKNPNTFLKFDVNALKDQNLRTQYAIETKNRFEHLLSLSVDEASPPSTQSQIDSYWEHFKTAVNETNVKLLPKKKKEMKQPWMTNEILDLMKERKQHKDKTCYKAIDTKIKKKCLEAKDDWLNNQCICIETLSNSGNQTSMYQAIKRFTSESKMSGGCIKNKKGDILFETNEIMDRWTEYVEELFHDSRSEQKLKSFLQGPEILTSEVEKALKWMKIGKASGIDNISSEMLQALGDFGINTLTKLCNNMYKNAYIPEDLRTSVFILLPKKHKAVECSDFRTISLMCHTLKLLLTVILSRISNKINREVGREQAGFRKNSGTREAIFCLRNLTEKYIEMKKDIFACFIDYSKAFDTVGHDRLIDILKVTEVDENDTALIASLYWNQSTRIRLGSEISPPLNIKRGVRQGCVPSTALFNLYTELIFRETNDIPGLKINGVNLNNLRYVDDTVLLAEDEKSLQDLVTAVKEESEKYGLMMNIKKTKVMILKRKKEAQKQKLK